MQQNLAAVFFERASLLGATVAVRYKEGRGPYRDLGWDIFSGMVKEMAAGLALLGLERGACAAILSQTSHLWVASDFSILSCGAVSVPVYPTSSQADIEYILNNSQSQVLFVQNEGLLKKVLTVRDDLPHLQKIILLSAPEGGRSLTELNIDRELVIGLEELQELGRNHLSCQPTIVEERMRLTGQEDLATVIYTSGTTGTPKGAKLTHGNVLTVLEDLRQIIPLSSSDVYLSFLPLSHVFERICGEFYWMHSGGVCAFAEGIEHVAKNMAEIEPSMILVVPRVLDRIYAKVKAGIAGASWRARRLIEWAVAVGEEWAKHSWEGRAPRPGLVAKRWLAEKLVLGKLRARIGRRLRLVVTGGAPATKEAIQFFHSIGITTLEGYGLTETTAPATVNRPQKIKIGTVGSVLPSVEIKLADDGEIFIKGPTVFKGYFNAELATSEAFCDGWFCTGDIGIIDGDGYITITDRKKDLIVDSAGKNIAPQKVESVLKTIPYVSQAIVFGDRKKHLVALLTVDEQATCEFARERNWTFNSFAELVAAPELTQQLRKEINDSSRQLADCERIRQFAILPAELSVETGELTPTLKIKRNVVAAKYKDLLDSLYQEESVPVLVSSAR